MTSRSTLPLAVATCLAAAAHAKWAPPAEPDVDAILDEAREDTDAGRYADALAKHVWYHRNALRYDPAQAGVRLSFALGDWRDLADQYPPAMAAMVRERDAARALLWQEGADVGEAFCDLEALNGELDDHANTVEVFIELHAKSPETASAVYRDAEPALAAAGHHEICGQYLRPDRTVALALQSHESLKEFESEQATGDRRVRRPKVADQLLAHRAGLLIALLVLNDREDEATEIADKVREALTEKAPLQTIDSALEGKLPSGFGY